MNKFYIETNGGWGDSKIVLSKNMIFSESSNLARKLVYLVSTVSIYLGKETLYLSTFLVALDMWRQTVEGQVDTQRSFIFTANVATAFWERNRGNKHQVKKSFAFVAFVDRIRCLSVKSIIFSSSS